MELNKNNRSSWVETTPFSTKNMTSIPFDKIDFYLMASNGAMGEPGRLSLYYSDGGKLHHYHGNSYLGLHIVTYIESCLDLDDMTEVYLGCGNFLYLKKELLERFSRASTDMSYAEMYGNLPELIMKAS